MRPFDGRDSSTRSTPREVQASPDATFVETPVHVSGWTWAYCQEDPGTGLGSCKCDGGAEVVTYEIVGIEDGVIGANERRRQSFGSAKCGPQKKRS